MDSIEVEMDAKLKSYSHYEYRRCLTLDEYMGDSAGPFVVARGEFRDEAKGSFPVAVKFFREPANQNRRDSLAREFLVQLEVQHKDVVAAFAWIPNVTEHELRVGAQLINWSSPAFVMGLCSGKVRIPTSVPHQTAEVRTVHTLADLCNSRPLLNMPWFDRLRLAEEAANGLYTIHLKHIEHGDVKSANIFICETAVAPKVGFNFLAAKNW
jgi:serine/threonine protein kinase